MMFKTYIFSGLFVAVLCGLIGPIINQNVNGYYLEGLVFGAACTLIWVWHGLNISGKFLNVMRKAFSKGDI